MAEGEIIHNSGEPFDPRKAILELGEEAFPLHARRLTFSERCGLAYALRRVSHETVRSAFGLSKATVSLLAQALKPGRKHYADVWHEWSRMSEDAFIDRHYTRDLHFRLKRVQLGLTDIPGAELDRNPTFAADPKADKYAYFRKGVVTLEDGSRWRIQWDFDTPFEREGQVPCAGWWFSQAGPDNEKMECSPVGPSHGKERLLGLEEKKPFRTSADAFDAIYELNGYESPRAKPGRPKNNPT